MKLISTLILTSSIFFANAVCAHGFDAIQTNIFMGNITSGYAGSVNITGQVVEFDIISDHVNDILKPGAAYMLIGPRGDGYYSQIISTFPGHEAAIDLTPSQASVSSTVPSLTIIATFSPDLPPEGFDADNAPYLPSGYTSYSFSGVEGSGSIDGQINTYYSGGDDAYGPSDPVNVVADFNISTEIVVTDQVTEPATWTMMLSGLCLAGFCLRSRRNRLWRRSAYEPTACTD